jgi:hypothetical protein
LSGFRRSYPRPVCWLVLSPESDTVDYSWEREPPEYGRDVLYVRARTAARAKTLAIRAFRKHWRQLKIGRPYIVRYYDVNPMAALTACRPGETIP